MSQYFRSLLGPRSFAPSLPVAGALFWLAPDYHIYTDLGVTAVSADGDHIEQWNDNTVNARNATQVTDGPAGPPFRPRYSTTQVDRSKNTVHFDSAFNGVGSGDTSSWFILPDSLATALGAVTSAEMFVVFKKARANIDPAGAGGSWKLGTSGSSFLCWTTGHIFEGFGTNTRKDDINPVIDLSAAFNVYDVYSAPNDYKIFLNGSQLFSTVTNTVAFPASGLAFGNDLSGFSSISAYISEVIIFPGKLSSGDRTTMTNYCT